MNHTSFRLSPIAKILTIGTIIGTLTACTSAKIDKQVNTATAAAQQKTDDVYANYGSPSTDNQPGVFDHSGYYLKEVTRAPLWLEEPVYISGNMMLRNLLEQILNGTDVSYSFTGGANPSYRLDNLVINGTVQQALDYISGATGYHYVVQNNTLTFSDMTTKTFYINAVPGQSSFGIGQSEDQYTIGTVSASSSGSGSGGSNGSQFSTVDGTINQWQDVHDSIASLASQDSKISITQSDSSVTVTDHWTNLEKISAWVKSYNQQLHKQISFKVQILKIQLNNQYAQGIDWSGLVHGAHVIYNSGIGFASVLDSGLTSSLSGDSSTLSVKNSNYLLFIQSLQQQGKVTVDQEPLITSLNNEAAEVKDLINTSYLQSIQNTVIPSGSSTASQNTLTPGNIVTGMEIYLLPHITQEGDIFLRVSASLGDLTAMQQQGSVQSGSGIQLPTIMMRAFNQNAVLKNGQTLVIAGFRTTTNKNSDIHHFDIPGLGGATGLSDNTELVLLITPEISEIPG